MEGKKDALHCFKKKYCPFSDLTNDEDPAETVCIDEGTTKCSLNVLHLNGGGVIT